MKHQPFSLRSFSRMSSFDDSIQCILYTAIKIYFALHFPVSVFLSWLKHLKWAASLVMWASPQVCKDLYVQYIKRPDMLPVPRNICKKRTVCQRLFASFCSLGAKRSSFNALFCEQLIHYWRYLPTAHQFHFYLFLFIFAYLCIVFSTLQNLLFVYSTKTTKVKLFSLHNDNDKLQENIIIFSEANFCSFYLANIFNLRRG